MDDSIRHVVVLGGGLAAAKAAETIREEGFDGAVTILTDEPERPYERPPLSKGFLLGKKPASDVYVHDPGFYRDHDIDLIIDDAATAIDRDTARVHTASGRALPFDRLLLATGASPRTLALADDDLDGILTLRTLEDSRRLSDELSRAEHLTVVGAGWIGCEVAAAARNLGVAVTMVDPMNVPLERVLGPEQADIRKDVFFLTDRISVFHRGRLPIVCNINACSGIPERLIGAAVQRNTAGRYSWNVDIIAHTICNRGHEPGFVPGILQHAVDHKRRGGLAVGAGHANHFHAARRKAVNHIK
jgi:NADH dehydrogenase FAD-containing subunit